jgi:hypothetical protein
MDQILHRKLINEKNSLQLEVAKANKQIAKLMETVQQYEAVLASLNEADIKIPTQIGLASQPILKKPTTNIHMDVEHIKQEHIGNQPKPIKKPKTSPIPGKKPRPLNEITAAEATKKMNRLDKGKELGEYGSAKERADNANLARLQRKSGIDLGIRGTHRESGGSVTPAGEGAEQRRMRQQEKTIQKFGN